MRELLFDSITNEINSDYSSGIHVNDVVLELFPYSSQYVTGITKSVKIVDARSPKISDHASPEKIGSRVIGQAPRAVVAAVSMIGRIRTDPLFKTASFNDIPSRTESLMNSIKTMEFLTTIPPKAIIPIIAVAVKKIGSANPPIVFAVKRFRSQKPGMIPIAVRGIADIITRGIKKEFVSITTRT